MKFNFKTLSLLGLVMTLCVAGLGIGYGTWSDTIDISGGTVIVENMQLYWYEQTPGDPWNGYTDTEGFASLNWPREPSPDY